MKPVVAILGRPNVGKSTLFNRLIGRRSALVDPTPGVTRDRREGDAHLGRLNFTVVDTAGLENAPANKTESEMQAQSLRALEQADVALLVIDARAGLTPLDRHFADLLRRSSTPVVLVANKCEARAADAGILEAWELGLGQPIPIAAEHGIGMPDLETAIADALLTLGLSAEKAEPVENVSEDEGAGAEEADADGDEEGAPAGPLQLAIVDDEIGLVFRRELHHL